MCYLGVNLWPKMVSNNISNTYMIQKKLFHTVNLPAGKRIGPHNQDVISVLVGNLLGDGYAEKRSNSTRFHIHLSSKNAEYVFWLHKFFAERGYCSATVPSTKKQIGKKNQVYFSVKFTTFSFKSLNWLHDSFYVEKCFSAKKTKKVVPTNIPTLLTKKALAVWIMDDRGKGGDGLKISTEGFSHRDNKLLQKALIKNFKLFPSIQRHAENHLLYFKKSDVSTLFALIKPHLLACMYYKFK